MCVWKTNEGKGEELIGLLGHLRYHERTHHGIVPSNVRQDPNNNSTTNEDGFGVAEMRDFRLTTAPRIIPEGSDDRVTKFHEGRFLMGPLNPRNLLLQAPVMQERPYGAFDLWHLGIPYVNPRAEDSHAIAQQGIKTPESC